MGLLSKLFGGEAKKPTDDLLLLQGMMLMMAADGVIQAEEEMAMIAFLVTLPEFKGKDPRPLIRKAAEALNRAKTPAERIQALAAIESPAIKQKCFVLAADIAMSSGDIDEAEDKLLTEMQKVLGVPDDLARKVVEVLGLKYAK